MKSFHAQIGMGLFLAAASLLRSAFADGPPGTLRDEPEPRAAAVLPDGWTARAPRDEIRPAFSFDAAGGPRHDGCLVITHDDRAGLDGWFQKSFPVTGGEFYAFRALRRTTGVPIPRRSALVRLLWQDDSGHTVPTELSPGVEADTRPVWIAEPEHPADGVTDPDGWTPVSGRYRAPARATRAVVELHLQWAPGGRVQWSEVALTKAAPPEPRKVRLAAVHYKPQGRSVEENRAEFAPLLAEAARQRADLVVLGETVPSVGVKAEPHEVAEPVPGPTTEYFGTLARTHHLHAVLSLYERDRHLVYNTAVLIGPDGALIGKYRKVCLPHGEVEKGVAPGHDYPVFETTFGKVGLMVCYDGFFPEVARALASRGAEVIAWPVYGCNPLLAQARACENHVFLVSSTFMEPRSGWMLTAVFDRAGQPAVQADHWGSVIVCEVDLNQPYVGPYNLGDFRAMVPRHRPVSQPEPGPERD